MQYNLNGLTEEQVQLILESLNFMLKNQKDAITASTVFTPLALNIKQQAETQKNASQQDSKNQVKQSNKQEQKDKNIGGADLPENEQA